MGLINELNAINRTLENNQRQLTKTEQREQDRIKKDRIKNIFLENLEALFEEAHSKNDLEKLTDNLIKNKSKNIDFVKEAYFEAYQEELTKKDIFYMDQFYYSFIMKVKKPFDYLYRNEEQRQKEIQKIAILEQEEEAKRRTKKAIQRQLTYNAIITILKYMIVLLATPFIIITAFVYGILKNTK